MALPATDSFTDSNGTALTSHSANWTQNNGAFDIQSNALAPNNSGDESGAHWNADAFDNDQYAEGVATGFAGNDGIAIGLAVRCHASADTYYGFYGDSYSGSGSYLFKMVSGTWTQIGDTGANWEDGDTVWLEVEGTTLTPKVNGSTDPDIGAQTDSSIASGSAGLSGYNDGAANLIDDWEGGNLGAGPGGISIPVVIWHLRQQGIS
jgi:hypothetical protein